ncbi:unnamed protein product, partial [marine sediment metagenome]
EIRSFVKTIDNVVWLEPDMPFPQVIQKYGYPAISKEQSQYISEYQNTKSDKLRDIRWNGNKYGRGKISEKWKYLVDLDFKISDKCCTVMKKRPAYKYEKATGLHPILGNMSSESSKRHQNYLLYGCNAFDAKRPTSKPISFWNDSDIYHYLGLYDVPYSKIYDMGYRRTGCMFCMFGIHMEEKPNRFQLMKQTHPKQYNYCMDKLGCKELLSSINVDY